MIPGDLLSLSNALLLLIFGAIAGVAHRVSSSFWELLISRTTCSMKFTSANETYQWIVDWLSEHSSMKQSLNVSVALKRGDASVSVNPENSIWLPDSLPSVHFLPGEGTHLFFHKGRPIWVYCNRKEKQSGNSRAMTILMQEITLYCIGTNRSFLEDIVKESMEKFYSKMKNKVTVYIHEHWSDEWMMGLLKTPRPLNSVILDDGISEKLVNDVMKFLQSRSWYESHGIPYRRGYLLYGPPGTGKTSFILALAGHLKKPICVVSIGNSRMTTSKLNILFNTTPPGSIILLEDIDSAMNSSSEDSEHITFSDLLNTLDGISSQEGNVVFMTTNHIENLDDALVRPGRIDMKVLLEKASKNQIRRVFRYFFPEFSKTKEEEIFASKVAERSFTTAELQSLFMQFRDDVQELLNNLEEYLKLIEKQREYMEKLKAKEKKKETPKAPDATSETPLLPLVVADGEAEKQKAE